MFHAGSVPRIKSKRTLVMNESDVHGAVTQRTRPAAQILLKDAPQPSYNAVRMLDGEHFALAWGRAVHQLAECRRNPHHRQARGQHFRAGRAAESRGTETHCKRP